MNSRKRWRSSLPKKILGTSKLMPRVYNFAPDARLERRGNTDYVNVVRTDGQIVRRPVRTFRGDLGSWRVTNLGMKWFARPGQPNSEYVLQIHVKLWETSRGRMDNPAIHYGWYPVSNLNPTLRRRIQATFTVPPPRWQTCRNS